MRMFLPIKGPGGRALTPNEKVALLVLGLTLVLCVLTLLAGESAYVDGEARNPVFAVVALLGGVLGAGILAFYGIVMLWSGLIYFRGERIAKVAPLGGRIFAAFMVALGVSGALGIARLGTAGDLGLIVGRALGNTFGAGIGFPVLLLIMMLGIHLSSQGVWSAFREAATAGLAPSPSSSALGIGLADAPRRRASAPTTLPDDGDPSADERTLAVTQAMEEIERAKGVTVVEMQQEADEVDEERASIGEEVEQVPPPAPDTEEAAILRGLRDVSEMLAPRDELEVMDLADVPAEPVQSAPPPAAEDPADYEIEDHGGIPVPTEAVDYPPAAPEAPPPPRREQTHFQWDAAAEEKPIEVMDIADVVSPEAPEAEGAVQASDESMGAAGDVEAPAPEAPVEGDPYAQGGLLRRLPQHAEDPPPDEEKPFTTFDWRGRPLE